MPSHIQYSERYSDELYEYRHVILPKDVARKLPDRLLTEQEWRNLGVQQSHGWVHYMMHKPEPHILLFRRERDYQERFGNIPRDSVPELAHINLQQQSSLPSQVSQPPAPSSQQQPQQSILL